MICSVNWVLKYKRHILIPLILSVTKLASVDSALCFFGFLFFFFLFLEWLRFWKEKINTAVKWL